MTSRWIRTGAAAGLALVALTGCGGSSTSSSSSTTTATASSTPSAETSASTSGSASATSAGLPTAANTAAPGTTSDAAIAALLEQVKVNGKAFDDIAPVATAAAERAQGKQKSTLPTITPASCKPLVQKLVDSQGADTARGIAVMNSPKVQVNVLKAASTTVAASIANAYHNLAVTCPKVTVSANGQSSSITTSKVAASDATAQNVTATDVTMGTNQAVVMAGTVGDVAIVVEVSGAKDSKTASTYFSAVAKAVKAHQG